jgi:hypothetical protein
MSWLDLTICVGAMFAYFGIALVIGKAFRMNSRDEPIHTRRTLP